MTRLFTAAALAAALCLGGVAQAAVLTFNNPSLIEIDNNTGVATYTESGFTISGPGASFLTLDSQLVGVFDSFSLKLLGGGPFALTSLDHGFYDFGFGDPPGVLTVTGLLAGVPVVSQMFTLGNLSSASFGTAWGHLTEVSFSGTTGFVLDNISAVPEPGTLALTTAGLLFGLGAAARGRRRAAVLTAA